jgi:hypothetical protein
MTGYARPERMDALAFSPLTIRPTLMNLIENEIGFAEEGKPAGIWIKMNSLVDEQLIDALYRASRAGVRVSAWSAASAACAPACRAVREHPRPVDRRPLPGAFAHLRLRQRPPPAEPPGQGVHLVGGLDGTEHGMAR